MRIPLLSLPLCVLLLALPAGGVAFASINDIDYGAKYKYPEYSPQKVVFDFYYDEPQKIATALYWVRSVYKALGSNPYGHAPDDMKVVIVIHGTEIVTLAKNNYPKYSDIVERLRYYAELGAEIRICSQAAELYGYSPMDFPDFVSLIPAAVVDLIYWQLKGYSIVSPIVTEKKYSLEEIR